MIKKKFYMKNILKDKKYSELNHKIYLNNLSSHAKRNNYLAMNSVGEIFISNK